MVGDEHGQLTGRGQKLDERATVVRAQQGDHEAYGSLVRQYEEPAFRAAYLIVRDEAEAKDVAQEAFIRAYKSLHRFDESRPFRPWLLRIVTNQAINTVRSARRRETMNERYEREPTLHGTVPTPETTAERAELARRVWEAVSTLKPDEQKLIYLRYFLDSSEEETATAIGTPRGTVKSRLHRALRRLRVVINEKYPDLQAMNAAEGLSGGES